MNGYKIFTQVVESPLGEIMLVASCRGLCVVEFLQTPLLDKLLQKVNLKYGVELVNEENDHLRQGREQLDQYFKGERQSFDLNLDLLGTDFQKKVWESLMLIPYGERISYQQQADLLQKPKAVRAVAAANGCNPISIILPCHRVVGKNGHLTGYAGGLVRKHWLLEHEFKYAESFRIKFNQ